MEKENIFQQTSLSIGIGKRLATIWKGYRKGENEEDNRKFLNTVEIREQETFLSQFQKQGQSKFIWVRYKILVSYTQVFLTMW